MKKNFLKLGLGLLTITLLTTNPILSLAQTTNNDNSLDLSNLQINIEGKLKNINSNVNKLNYINKLSHVFPMPDQVSDFDSATQTKLLQLVMPILKEEFRIDLNNGLYPATTQNAANIDLIFKNNKIGSEAIRTYDNKNHQVMCKVFLGIQNDNKVPTLDFYEVAKKLNVKLNPNFTRQFVLLHELAHCEANFRGAINYQNQALTPEENKAFENFASDENGLIIESNHLYSYFDETFADTYAAINFLKLYNFSPESLEYIKEIANFRIKFETYWQENNKDIYFDPHSSAKSLTLLSQALKDPIFIEKLKDDKNSQLSYDIATKLASKHLDDLITNQKFTKKINNMGLEFDDNLQKIINKIQITNNNSVIPIDNQLSIASNIEPNSTNYTYSKNKRDAIQQSLNQTKKYTSSNFKKTN